MRDPTFQVHEPEGGESPVLVEVPHAGLWLDADALAYTVAPARSIGRDADLHVDRIFEDAPSWGATLIVSSASRYYLDLNRGPDEFDAEAVEHGQRRPIPRGLVWRLTTEGERILRHPLPVAELERRLELSYRPYHEAIRDILARKQRTFGFVVLVCAHSMPTFGQRGPPPMGPRRADLVPGSRGRTSAAPEVIDTVDRVARERGFSVRHDDPYRGGFSTATYGRPDEGMHAIQIEIARSLYMDEDSLKLDPAGLARARGLAEELVLALGAIDAATLTPSGSKTRGAAGSSART